MNSQVWIYGCSRDFRFSTWLASGPRLPRLKAQLEKYHFLPSSFFYIFLFYGTYSSLSNAPSNHHTECALRKLCLIGTLVFINHWQLSVFTYEMVWGAWQPYQIGWDLLLTIRYFDKNHLKFNFCDVIEKIIHISSSSKAEMTTFLVIVFEGHEVFLT